MYKSLIIRSRKIVSENGIVNGYLVIRDGQIKKIRSGEVKDDGKVINVLDQMVIPGFIDLHIHGAGGWQVGSDSEEIKNMADFLSYHGVTSYYATISAVEKKELKSTISAINNTIAEQYIDIEAGKESGAEILSIHLEGPFLNSKKKGAMQEKYFLDSAIGTMKEFEEISEVGIGRVTLAPEKNNALSLIKYLTKKGYTVAGGHTDSTYEQMKAGIDAGITVANHMYNAMSGLHHRRPGAVGAYLTDDRVSCEFIGDTIHVHPAALNLLLRAKGVEKAYLISDAVLAAGLPAGNYQFAGRKIHIDETGVSRLTDGTIAGSTFLMSEGFKNLIKVLGLSWIEAVQLASTNPARIAGVLDRKGSLKAGKDADIIVINENFEITYSLVRGVFHKTPEKNVKGLLRKDFSSLS